MIRNIRNNYWIILKKNYSQSANLTRVRFAPSPTGFLHLGGLRTAVYNFLHAKSRNGTFILRIEDTDRTRLVEGALEKIIEDLTWIGIKIDEGPGQIGGKYGPYVQSQRFDIYREKVKELLDNGTAYYCFCSERRLDLLRKEALRTRQVPKYDNKCRHLTPIQIAEKLTKNRQYCIRFKLEEYLEPINDLIYGPVKYNVHENEGDPVIIKTDGFPTYHLANVVDDHLMEITHVFRGVEWQISTTKHLLMYRAFGWQPPFYGHLPLLVNQDGTKLSKRQGDIQISHYRDKGIFPRAVVNYVIQAGGGFDKEPSSKPITFSIEDLAAKFDITKVNCNPGRLNPDILKELNRFELLRLLEDPATCDKLIESVKELVKKTYQNQVITLDLSTEHVRNILKWSGNRLDSLHDLIDTKFSFLWIIPEPSNVILLDKDVVGELLQSLDRATFTKTDLQQELKQFCKGKNLSFSKVMKSLRTLLSGLQEGPGVAEMMEILGKASTMQRIQRAKNV